MIMTCLIGFLFLLWLTRKLTLKLRLNFLLFPCFIFGLLFPFNYYCFQFYCIYFLCKLSHTYTSVLSINSPAHYVQQLCWFSHLDNNDDDDANSNDISNDKRSQRLLSACGLAGAFLNALKVWFHWNLMVILWSNIYQPHIIDGETEA